MAIVPSTKYSGRIDTSDPTGYPHGKAKNVTVTGDGTGTPLEKDWLNDVFGFQQALLDAAGITPSGTPDKVGTSEYLDALNIVTNARAFRLALANHVARTPGGTDGLEGVAYESGSALLWCAVGWNGKIKTSPDGITWTDRTPDASYSDDFYAVYAGAGRFVAVGQTGAIQTSTNGTAWTARTAAGGFTGTFYSVTATSGNSNDYIAVGASGTIQTTADAGVTWASRTAAGGFAGTFYGVASNANNSLRVAVGTSGTIQTSPDGITWTSRTAAGGFVDGFRGVCFGNPQGDSDGLWVAVGANGQIQTSPDGTTWTARTSGTSELLIGIRYHAGMFVAVGENGTIVTSTNGKSWTTVSNSTYTEDLNAIATDGKSFVVVGTDSGSGPEIRQSLYFG